jgi:hypothetical protein
LLKVTAGTPRDVPVAAWTAFFASLLLSLIAILASDDLNRDGMLYVDAARALMSEGWDAARARFDWLFMPALIGGASLVTGLEPEVVAYGLGALLLGTMCALTVLISARVFPGVAWAACLVVLAMPAFNAYRDHIIREFGFWCFTLVAIWGALRWSERQTWVLAIGSQLALVVAAAFRVEALALLPVVVVWQLYAVRRCMTAALAVKVLALPMVGITAACVPLAFDALAVGGRLKGYWLAVDLAGKGARFDSQVQAFQSSVLPELSRSDAHYMLLFGLLSAIPVKFLKGLGIFVVPLLFTGSAIRWKNGSLLLNVLFVIYCLILAAFVTGKLFVTGRYVSYLNLLAVPIVAYGCGVMVQRWPRLKWWLVAAAVVAMLANVVSFSRQKPQFKEAAAWLVQNVPDASRVYVEGRRVRYHAGYPLGRTLRPEVAVRTPHRKAFDLFVVERGDDADATALPAWLAQHQLELVTRFDGPGADVLVLKPRQP